MVLFGVGSDPFLGFDSEGAPHLRIEHRVMPAGPTIVDTVANLALCHGLMLALAKQDEPPENYTGFERARENFYACAKHGLDADVRWEHQTLSVQRLMLETLIPLARTALMEAGVDTADVVHFIDEVIVPRVRSGRTGAAWQRSFVECNSHNFQAMTERYLELQSTGAPVHTWDV